jgi:hypothetical protein
MRSARQSGNCFGRALARMYGGEVAEVFGKQTDAVLRRKRHWIKNPSVST